MKWLIALLLTCSSVLGQGFGSFTYDQPFLAGGVTYNPTSGVPNMTYWWVAEDNGIGTNITSWADRIKGNTLVQTNAWRQPTNSSDGVCFDGSKWMYFNTPSAFVKTVNGCSTFVVYSYSPMGKIGAFFSTIGGESGLYISRSNTIVHNYGSFPYNLSQAIPTGQLVDVGIIATNIAPGSNAGLSCYTNGVFSATNYITGVGNYSNNVVGGGHEVLSAAAGEYLFFGYIKEIMVWTNYCLKPDDLAYLHAYKQWKYSGGTAPSPWFNPNGVPGMKVWARADGIVSKALGNPNPLSGDRTYLLIDSSTNQGNYFQASSPGNGARWYPTLGPNSKPTLNMGDNDVTKYGNINGFNQAQPNYYFFVINQTNHVLGTSGTQDLWDGGGSREGNFILGNTFQQYAGSSQNYPMGQYLTNKWTVICSAFNGSSSFVRTNGVLVGTGNPGASTLNGVVLGDYSAGGYQYQGYMSEVQYFGGSTLTTNNIQDIERALCLKYGITYSGQ